MDMENMEHNILERILDGSMEPSDIPFSLLETITENFSEHMKIGEGGFGTVYKGVLRNGKVAVKRIKNHYTIDEKLFRRENNNLLEVNHPNIVRFLGFCSSTWHKVVKHEGEYIYPECRERILCFEYIENRSLQSYITDELSGLDWNTRYNIVKGICEGLEYLHIQKGIIHMDLKPGNILLDNHMVAKITDFGQARRDERSQTNNHIFTRGYCAPEYIIGGPSSLKCDVYSLGVIIIEIVTGHRDIPDKNNVIQRWGRRWSKSVKEILFRYQQLDKLIEIGLQCQAHEPHNRLSVSQIICDINELESTIINAKGSTVGQTRSSISKEVIKIYPPQLCFPLVSDKKVLSSIEIVNNTGCYVCFNISDQKTNTAIYTANKPRGTLLPWCKQWVTITREENRLNALKNKFNDKLFVWYTIVTEGTKACDLDHTDFRNLEKLPIVLKEISPCTLNELIQFDPPELSFPCQTKTSFSSVDIVNITDFYIGFNIWSCAMDAAYYMGETNNGILPPWSTRRIVVKRVPNERELQDTEREDNLFVWNMIVAEGVEASYLSGYKSLQQSKELPLISLKKISPCTSDKLIRFEPPELCFPFFPDKALLSSVNMVNLTDFPVCFSGYASKENKAWYWTEPMNGIIAPRSSKKLLVKGVTMGNELPHMKCEDNYFMWSGIVSEGVKPGDLGDYVKNEESTELPIVLTKMSSSTSNELIQIEPSHLCFPFLPNKILSSSMKIVNITDHYVGFGTLWKKNNVAFYDTEPQFGILPPHSTQQVVVTRVSKEDALGDLECEDRYIVWSSLVTGGAKADDLGRGHIHITKQTKEFPVIFEKRSSNELVKFDPAELCLPLWPNKSVLSSVKIVNVTEHYIGFNVCTKESNSARYYTSPSEGILPPGSTQVLVVTRIAKKNEPEVAECKSDKYFVWNGIVAQGVVASSKAIADNMSETKITMLPIGLTKPSSSDSSDELIQFDPSELCFPLLTNQKVLSSIEIVNTTEYNIGFNTYGWGSNSAWYHIKPPRGILPAWSKQNLLVEREEKEDALKYTEFNDKYFVWNTIVTQGVEESDLADYRVDQHSKELPIVLLKISPVWILQKIPTKFVKYAPTLIHVLDRIRSVFLQRSLTSLSTRADKLIRLDPPEICSSFMLNKGWLSKVDIINVTDFYVAFNLHYCPPDLNELSFEPTQGILPPRSTQTLAITRQAKEIELEDGQCRSTHFVWNRIVTESVKVSNINDYMIYEESVEIPIVLTEISTCTSDEPIQFNPPELTFSFSPNKVLLSAVNIVNITDHYVGYNSYVWDTNGAWYIPQGGAGILRPRSTRRICVKRVTKEMELQDMQCLDKFFVWNKIVTKGMKTRDIMKYMAFEESKELPIVLEKTSISTSNELITFDPPNISFPFRPNNRMVSLFKIVNITNHKIGFSICTYENDSVEYEFNLEEGILAPQSIQEIKITRIPKGEVSEDTPLEDDVVFVWNAIVAEGVEVEDLIDYMDEDESKQLPIIFTKPGERSSM